jgi:hypothetical protein
VNATWRLLDAGYSVDRLLPWFLLGAFLLLAIYGTLSGVTQELAAWGSGYPGFNIAGFPHEEALALGSWIVLGLLLLTMLASFRERRQGVYLLGALVTLSAAVPLLAGQFENQIATATAWRWLAAIFFLGGSLLLWYRQRLGRFGWPAPRGDVDAFAKQARTLLITLTVLPLIVLTAYPALRTIYYLPVQGPTSGLFSWFDDDFSYGVPLVLVAFVMIGYALRERIPEFAFYAGAFFNATVTLAFLLAVVAAKGPMDRLVLVRLAQLNAMTFAVYSLPWMSTRRRWQTTLSESALTFVNYLLKLQVGVAVVLNVLLILPVVLKLVLVPDAAGIATVATGSFLGWLTFAITVVAVAWLAVSRTIELSTRALAGLLLAISCFIAFSAADVSGWIALHVLTVCTALTAWLMFVAGELDPSRTRMSLAFDVDDEWQSTCRKLATIVGGIAVFLSLRALADDEVSRWWSIGPLLAMTSLFATLSWKTQRRGYIYAAGILFNLTVSLWWIFNPENFRLLSEFLLVNLIAGALAGILWLWLELRARQRRQTELNPDSSFHNLAAIISLSVLALFVMASLLVNPQQSPLQHNPELSPLAFLSVTALMTACLWDRHAKYAVAGLYVLGLIAGAMVLHFGNLTGANFAWASAMLLAAYTLFTTLLWRHRARLIALVQQFGITPRIGPEASELPWFSTVTIVAVAVIGTLAYWITLSFTQFELRAEVALAVAAQFLAFSFLAEGISEQKWKRIALGILVIGAILFGWSWLTPQVDGTWLNRSVILMLVAFGLTAAYGFLLDKAKARFPEWISPARALLPWLLGAGVVALFFCLGTEVSYQINFGAVNIHPLSLLAIGLTLIAAIVLSVLFALSPNHDPLSLSERGRMRYVYAAEVMLALLFLHIRLTLPWLFTGFIERYWPLVVMLIAYFGVVTSEALRRRKLIVLAQPLERTGVFLPLLPVLGFWLASSEVDFSLVLFVVGGLYGLLSVLRRSFLFGVLAAVAGNAGLWYIFDRTADYQFLQHPQLWLIPVALSVLLAAYLNEDKLTEDQMTGVRYLSLVTIYASSTADIFINGVANSPWLPLILGSFSLAGVFAGIVFRIRGLLLLGAIFLLLSIITMIWYASVNLGWTWLWYVAGIVTGATIIFMFALFEKKRGEVLRVVEGLKEWDR